MEKPKLALLFFGMSVNPEYRHWGKFTVDIHWKKFDFFEKKGYDIDVYFTTNTLNDTEK